MFTFLVSFIVTSRTPINPDPFVPCEFYPNDKHPNNESSRNKKIIAPLSRRSVSLEFESYCKSDCCCEGDSDNNSGDR